MTGTVPIEPVQTILCVVDRALNLFFAEPPETRVLCHNASVSMDSNFLSNGIIEFYLRSSDGASLAGTFLIASARQVE